MRRPFLGLEGDGSQMRTLHRLAAEHGLTLKSSVLGSSLPGAAAVLQLSDGFAVLPEAAGRDGLVAVDAPLLGKLNRTILLVRSARRRATRGMLPKWQRLLAEHLAWE